MLVQTYFPQKLSPSRYDAFLASGWFRGSVMLYKMDLLCIENDLFSVVNIRLNLDDFEQKKRQRKIARRIDRNFTTVYVNSAQPNANKEALYESQKKKFKGFIHHNLQDYLNSGFHQTVFNTKEVNVYDGDRLIAVSFFDLGEKSMASLLCLYDPEYENFSLGIYTMLKEVEYGKKNGIKWYYPGYVLDQPSTFNYKLKLGNFEHYNENKRWVKFENFDPSNSLAHLLKNKVAEIKKELTDKNLPFQEVLYPYFSMGYAGMWNIDFVRFPIYLTLDILPSNYLVSYDIDSRQFCVLIFTLSSNNEHLINMELSEEFKSGSAYQMNLLEVLDVLYVSNEPELLVRYIRRNLISQEL